MTGKQEIRQPSDRFVRLVRDPGQAWETLNKPSKVERTIKAPGDIVI